MNIRSVRLQPGAFVISGSVVLLTAAALTQSARAADAYAEAAAAPNDTGTQIQEIVVTSQRREERLQDVPIAVSAFTAESVRNLGVVDTTSLNGIVPSLSISTNGPSNAFFIRGVGSPVAASNGEQSVAMYVDGVYMYSAQGNMFPIGPDIERIEVLKGPQGTLFGRNSTAGVIQIITKDPSTEPGMVATVGYGNYQTLNFDLYGTTGVLPGLATDLVVSEKNQAQGYGTNLFNGQEAYRRDTLLVKNKWLWTPTDSTQVRATFQFTRLTGTTSDIQIQPGKLGLDGNVSTVPPYDINANWPNNEFEHVFLGALQVDQDFGWAKLESITSFRNFPRSLFQLDDDATPAAIVNANSWHPDKTFTQELRLLSRSDSKLNWAAGVFYINDRNGTQPLELSGAALGPQTLDEFDTQRLSAIAPYGQATAEVFKDTNLTLGVRWNHEHLSTPGTSVYSPPGNKLVDGIFEETTYHNTSWRVSIDHKWLPEIMTYVSANRSFKSGGYNLSAAPGTALPPFLPEQVTAYEIGAKTELFDRRLRLNVAGYRYDYIDIQVQSSIPAGTFTGNGPSARFNGLDFDFSAVLMDGLTVNGGGNWVKGRYGAFPNAVGFTGNPFEGQISLDGTDKTTVYTPLTSGTLGLDYALRSSVGEFAFNANLKYSDKVYTAVTNRQTIPEYVVVNNTLTWTPNNSPYEVRLWVLNTFNKKYLNNVLETGTGDWQIWAPPRTYGVSFTARFGSTR